MVPGTEHGRHKRWLFLCTAGLIMQHINDMTSNNRSPIGSNGHIIGVIFLFYPLHDMGVELKAPKLSASPHQWLVEVGLPIPEFRLRTPLKTIENPRAEPLKYP